MSTEGDEKLAFDIDLVKYVSCRKNEIDLLKSESFLSKEDKTKSLFQMLPRHMRRRTMGYLRKRLPRRIRALATIQPPKLASKRPSRKYRRKRSNLLKEYERRKHANNNKMWLETHIWHAKRFHMSESLYEYRLPVNFHCKCRRAVFKCLKDYSIIHDESYHVCHQLDGTEKDLISGLTKLCSQEAGLTFGAKMYTEGQFEGKLTLYEADKYPYSCIGPIRFLWKPREPNQEIRSLWIWSHPAIYREVEKQLVNVFNLTREISKSDDSSPDAKKRKLLDDSSDLNLNPLYKSNLVTLTSLKDKLIRFKLAGPMSTSILANVLQTVGPESSDTSYFTSQAKLWSSIKNSISSPNEVTAALTIGLLVKDPRLILPKKKSFNKSEAHNANINCYSNNEFNSEIRSSILNTIYSHSTIWNQNLTNKLALSKISTHEINKLRSKFLIPGTDMNNSIESPSKIPILLIQSSMNNKLSNIKNGSFFSGWDIVMPSSWGMAFWLPLIHMGARAVGQFEMNYLLFESGNLQFPNEFNDTKSSTIENEKLKHNLYAKHIARPPSKRVNYLKNSFMAPFSCPWTAVKKLDSANLNSPNTGEFFILRNRRLISKLETLLFNKNRQLKLNDQFNDAELDMIEKSFVGVRLSSFGKGDIEKFSHIYEENTEDTKTNQDEECVNTSVHKLITESKSQILETTENSVPINKLLRAKFNKQSLLLNDDSFFKHELNMIGSEGYRRPIGFAQTSSFSLVSGKCAANAFVLTKSILKMAKRQAVFDGKKRRDGIIISYRTPSSNSLRKAKIDGIFV